MIDEYSHKQDSNGFITVNPLVIGRLQGCESATTIIEATTILAILNVLLVLEILAGF